MLRGSPHARMIRSIDVGSGWLARKRSTRRVFVAAGTWLMAFPPPVALLYWRYSQTPESAVGSFRDRRERTFLDQR